MKTTSTHFIIHFFTGILVTFFMTSYAIFAQEVLHIDWESKLTNSNGASEKSHTQIEAANGSAFVAGYRSTETGKRMYIACYNSAGTTDWEVDLPSELESGITRLVIYNDGDLFVAGEEQTGGSNAPIIHYARITQEGKVVWHYTFDGDGGKDAEMSWMEVVNDHIYMIGTETGENDYEIAWAAEFDLDGNLNWKTAFDPGTNTGFSDIQVNNKGDIAACGWAEYGYSYLLVGFDKNGAPKWQFPENLTDSSEQWFNDIS